MTDTGDVLDNYLLWELCKQQNIQEIILEESKTGERVNEIIEKVKREYRENNYNRSEKINRIKEISKNASYRCSIFEQCSWTKETVKVEDLGTTLPHAMGLPPEVITGSLPEVVKFVREADPKEYRGVKYINSLKQVPEIPVEFPTTVVTPGSFIRERKRMNKEHGKKDWGIEDTWGAVHDGNHRTIAKIIANDLEEIECYVGRP